jgi:predicted DNA-binding transcriptional regulator YafY
MRMLYASPWSVTPGAVTYDIEPWAIHIHDTTHYFRVWSITHGEARTFNLEHVHALHDVTDAPPRRPVPKNPWPKGIAFGIDSDHPCTAVIRLRGPVARWQRTKTWHPAQTDDWREKQQLLERTLPIHSRREFVRFLGTLPDAIVAIGPPELADAFIAHCKPALRIQKLPARP